MTGRPVRRALALAGVTLAVAALCALGTWQLQRREWKHDLIARVDQRIHAAAIPAPASADGQEYRHVTAHGHYAGPDTLVTASTDFGPGFWVITPLVQDDGVSVLVNRGFIPSELRQDPPPPPPGTVDVTGLLRLTEPKGGFLRANDPAQNRWYSRDVAAIASARGVAPALPYFIDAEAAGSTWPRGGLTVVAFPDSHLVYALTWFAMALTLAVFTVRARLSSHR